jgi:hypothetical protein
MTAATAVAYCPLHSVRQRPGKLGSSTGRISEAIFSVHGAAFHKDGLHNLMSASRILQKLIKQIPASFARTVPQVMVRVTNGQVWINRFLNHHPNHAPASRFMLLSTKVLSWSLMIGH